MAPQHSDSTTPLFEYEAQQSLRPVQPPPGDLKEIRLNAGYSLKEVAAEVSVSAATIGNWERGQRSSGPRWRAYCELLHGWTRPAPPPRESARPPVAPTPAKPPVAPVPAPRPARTLQHPHLSALGPNPGSVAVLSARDGALYAHLPDGRSCPCPISDLAGLPGWAATAGFTPWRRSVDGRIDTKAPPRPPLIALTAAALRHLHLPATCRGADRPAVEDALIRAGWPPTPGAPAAWPLLLRGVPGGLQLALLPWEPTSTFHLPGADPEAIARLLGDFTELMLPPCGPPDECTVQLMRNLRPALDCQPPDHAPQRLDASGPHAWWRQPDRAEIRTHPWVIALALTTPLAAEAKNICFSSEPLRHHLFPEFDPEVPGRWLAELTAPGSDRLPSPLSGDGRIVAGPAWYPTGTAQYAHRFAGPVRPAEAWLHHGPTARYLSQWGTQLSKARRTVMHRLGLDTVEDPGDLADALQELPKRIDPHHRALLAAITATEASLLAPHSSSAAPPGWLPYTRAELAAWARTKLHQKLLHTLKATAALPLAVTPHLMLFCAPTDDVFQIVPRHRPLQTGMALHLGIGSGRVRPVGAAALEDYRDLTADLDRADPAAGDQLRHLLPADAVD